MSTYKISTLTKAGNCPFSGYMSQFNVRGEETRYLHLLSLNKKVIKEGLLNKRFGSYEALEKLTVELDEFFEENVNKDMFYSVQAYKSAKDKFVINLQRFAEYLDKNGGRIIRNYSKQLKGDDAFKYKDHKIETSFDFIVEFSNKIEVVKLKNSAPKLSYSNRAAEKNRPHNSLELYVLQEAGRNYIKNCETIDTEKPVVSAFYHLVGKNDVVKKGEQDTYALLIKEGLFNSGVEDDYYYYKGQMEDLLAKGKKRESNKMKTQMKRIISIRMFDGFQGSHIIRPESNMPWNLGYIKDELDRLLSIELTMDSEKCDSSECDICPSKVICMAKKYKHIDLEEVIEEKSDKPKKQIKPTEEQQKVIDFDKGFGLVNAGSGSGKTQTSANRVKTLFEKGCRPKDILLITFTEKAAREFKERVSSMTGIDPNQLHVFTFNGFGNMILSNEYSKMGFSEPPSVITNIEKVDVLLELIKNEEYHKMSWMRWDSPLLNMPHAKGVVYELIEAFNKKKAFDHFGEEYYDWQCDMLQGIYDDYNKTIFAINKIEYADQLILALEFLSKHKSMLNRYSYRHISVDEINDSNEIQIKMMQLLATSKKFQSLLGVGDVRQNIFRFANADVKYMVNFDKYFKDPVQMYMNTNFRSTQNICDLANSFIALNTGKKEQDMISFSGYGEDNTLLAYDTKKEEYDGIVELIKNSKEQLQDICVIASQRAELYELSEVLSENNIPNRIMATEPFINNPYVRLLINLSKYVVDPSNDQYLLEYIMAPLQSYSINGEQHWMEETKEFLYKRFNFDAVSFIDTVMRIEDEESFEKETKCDKVAVFNCLIEPLLQDGVCYQFYDHVTSKPFYSMKELSDRLKKYVTYKESTAPVLNEKKYKTVSLFTAHGSKGLEFNEVITTLNKFKYPENNQDDLNEVRRALFVALTRAKKKNWITFNTNEDKKRGAGKYVEFADEIVRIINER